MSRWINKYSAEGKHGEGYSFWVKVGCMLLLVAGTTGCFSMRVRREEMPRVDQELRGNQGYLVGSDPLHSSAEEKPKRTITRMDFEFGS